MFHCQALLEVHDNVAFKKYASPPASPGPTDEAGTMNGFGGQPIRMVGLHKQPKKPLVCPDLLFFCRNLSKKIASALNCKANKPIRWHEDLLEILQFQMVLMLICLLCNYTDLKVQKILKIDIKTKSRRGTWSPKLRVILMDCIKLSMTH